MPRSRRCHPRCARSPRSPAAGCGRRVRRKLVPPALEQRRQYVDMARRCVHDARPEKLRRVDHQRHAQHFFIRKDAVARLAMVSQRFAVVRGHHHKRATVPAGCEDRLEQRRQRRVGGRHFAEVRIARPSETQMVQAGRKESGARRRGPRRTTVDRRLHRATAWRVRPSAAPNVPGSGTAGAVRRQ